MIISLNVDDPSDLLSFQRFIHHRAYRKLGYRVLDFCERWGASPIDILSQSLDSTMEPFTPQFNTEEVPFHNFLQKFVAPVQLQLAVYVLNFGNASCWLQALQTAWNNLRDLVLVKGREDKSPNNQQVVGIVIWTKVLDHLLPVLKHISSTPKAGAALALAGASGSSLLLLCAQRSAEINQYNLTKRKRQKNIVPEMPPAVGVNEESDSDFVFPDDRESNHFSFLFSATSILQIF